MGRPAYGGRRTCEGSRSIDVRRWHREGRLNAGQCFIASWTRDGEPAGRMVVRAVHGAIILIKPRPVGQGRIQPSFQRVSVAWTGCHLGGERPWFVCGGVSAGRRCGRRAAILYDGGGVFACRNCYRLAYASQQETALYRSLRRARKIRARLGASPSLADALPTKPRGMHTSTYRRLLTQAQRAHAALDAASAKRFGLV
jgi:hypothetical protein